MELLLPSELNPEALAELIMERLCQEYLDILPRIYKTGEETDCTLHHSDLNAVNILVNPETWEITSIVDWEMINIVPAWRASDHPKFLGYMEPDDEEAAVTVGQC